MLHRVGDRLRVGNGLIKLAELYVNRGDLDHGRMLLQRALSELESVGARRLVALAGGLLGEVDRLEGDVVAAGRRAAELVAFAEEANVPVLQAFGLGLLAEVDPDPAGVADGFATAEAIFERHGYPRELGALLCRKGRRALASGDLLGARRALERAVAIRTVARSGPWTELSVGISDLQNRIQVSTAG
jgi:hypothetical protein